MDMYYQKTIRLLEDKIKYLESKRALIRVLKPSDDAELHRCYEELNYFRRQFAIEQAADLAGPI